MRKLSFIERVKIKLGFPVYVGHRKEEGWSDSLPFYAFNCPVHGVVEDYPSGYKGRLYCTLCNPTRHCTDLN